MNDLIFTARIGHNVGEEADALTAESITETAFEILKFDGATIYEARGVWRSGMERATVIEIAGLDEQTANAYMNALPDLAAALDQTSVYGTITAGTCRECFATPSREKKTA